MATNYAISTEFLLKDKTSAALAAVSNKWQGLEKKLSGPLLAAEKRFSALGQVAKTAALGGVAAIGGAAAVAIKSAIPLAMELEQNLGGTEVVFGSFAENIQTLAEDAYKNMGLSASDYMATANKMGSLFQGSGLSQAEALELTTKAMQRAADVASVMGVDVGWAMESIAGAAKGNFTMMDNLGVAMNATAIEAYALEKGMNFKWNAASTAEKELIAMQMFFERTAQFAGNFAREADDTLSGSLGRMKTNMSNILAKMALGEDVKPQLANLQDSVASFAKNIVPTIVNLLNELPALFAGVMAAIQPTIESAMKDLTGPFGFVIEKALKLIDIIWKLRVPIIAITGAFFVWNRVVDTIFLISKTMKIFNTVMTFARNSTLLMAAATKIATVAQLIFNTAMSANPIGAVITILGIFVGLIIVLTGKWRAVSEAVNGFFEKINNMSGIGGFILKVLITPLELLWKRVQSIVDVFSAFKDGGLLAGIKMIGLAILQWLAAPIEALLKMLSFIPGLGWLNEKLGGWFETTRAGIMGWTTEDGEAGTAAGASTDMAMLPPTQTALTANNYTKEESAANVNISLDEKLKAGSYGLVAPGVTVQRTTSGAF